MLQFLPSFQYKDLAYSPAECNENTKSWCWWAIIGGGLAGGTGTFYAMFVYSVVRDIVAVAYIKVSIADAAAATATTDAGIMLNAI